MVRGSEEQQEETGNRTRKNRAHQEEDKEAEEIGGEEAEAEGAGTTTTTTMIMIIITTPKAVELEEVDPSLIEGTETEKGSNRIGRTTKPRGREREKEKTKDIIPQNMIIERAAWRTERELEVLQEGIDPQEMKGGTRDRRGESRTQIDGNRPLRGGAGEIIPLKEGEI